MYLWLLAGWDEVCVAIWHTVVVVDVADRPVVAPHFVWHTVNVKYLAIVLNIYIWGLSDFYAELVMKGLHHRLFLWIWPFRHQQ
jgi:hypothetical protein